jgi:hypothetical protein
MKIFGETDVERMLQYSATQTDLPAPNRPQLTSSSSRRLTELP